ncbi:methyl-accepting chemotaxis protein [Roseibium album]|uniref:Methyl-accepting chemotaxis protein 3 n=1 Tax=Roseibium album TaxID=311410 RepID=A0A0M6ZBV1_9HYPH|nr:HAMP domain-containing methyl-accepting chemotaxis protein [Roseibium album]CTQ59907.1 Methyl-accepting chemotaxis protein 3 [Roseibium album]CTQ76707.1 Methyl-accepting chemotaxis protein 3 [Roseibium album]CTQ77130.1 Methyl-accepting chemotaxis protein 3 [Roseibium album]
MSDQTEFAENGRKKVGLLDRLRIRTRINLLVLLTMVAVSALGITYLVGRMGTVHSLESKNQYATLYELVQSVEIGALQMRRSEKDFLLRRDTKYIGKYDAAVSKVNAALMQMADLEASAAVLENIEKLQNEVDHHKEQFHKVAGLHQTVGLNEKDGLEGELRQAVHNVEELLKTAKLDSLTVKMLMMRRHEKDFMMRGKEKYVARIDKRREEFDALLGNAALPEELSAKLTILMDSYQAGFKSFAKTSMLLKPETKKLSQIFAEMQPDFARIREAADEGQAAANAHFTSTMKTTDQTFLAAGIGILAAVIFSGFLIGRSITSPIARLNNAMKSLAEGDVETEVPLIGLKTEIGEMAGTVEIFKNTSLERMALMNENERDQEMRAGRQTKVDDLIGNFRETVLGVLEAVNAENREMETSAGNLSTIASQTTSQADSVSSASKDASNNVQAVAAATETLSESIGEISRQVSQTKSIVEQATDATIETDTKIAGLADSADKIGEVILLIQGIAEQTNLLALNATIEAARAGEAGKGFAVVASEVKELATQTAKATEAISTQITDIQKETESSVDAIRGIAETMREVSSATEAISAAVEEQGSSTAEITANVNSAAAGSNEVSENIVGVQQAADESQDSVEKVLSAAKGVSANTEQLRDVIEEFLGDVAAA